MKEGIKKILFFANAVMAVTLALAFLAPAASAQEGNSLPVANDDSASTYKNVSVTIDVLANDTDDDEGDMLSVASVTDPANGTVVNNGTDVAYTPDASFEGTDTFTYYVSDGTAESEIPATITIDVGNHSDEQNQTIPPGQMVRRGLSGSIDSWLSDEGGNITYIFIPTNFGVVQVDVSAFNLTEEDIYEGMRVAVKLEGIPSNVSDLTTVNVNEGEEPVPYRTAIAEQLKIIPNQASYRHEWGSDQISLAQGNGTGKQFKGFQNIYKIQSRLETLIGQAEETENQALLQKLQQRLEKHVEKQQQLMNKAQQHNNQGQNRGNGKK